ncbi:MAG: HNH endonuclease signature motif containing protein, partial [Gammaproteobacteria bacterium]|nr:HNH endonuclease signature motif containing protein [Gammaproteobacteria bacterium]
QDTDAKPLWEHFRAVIAWVQKVFPQYRREMKGLDWGAFYAEFKGREFDAEKLERDIARLMQDDDIKKKSGIYAYLLTGGEHHLNIRAFTPAQKRSAFERQKGKCPVCKKQFGIDDMEGDHITPWREGGKTEPGNCQMLCKECNRRKGGR